MGTCIWLALVECPNVVEFNLFPDEGLERGFCLLAMVVAVTVIVVFVAVARMIVPMMRHSVSSLDKRTRDTKFTSSFWVEQQFSTEHNNAL